MNRSHKHNRMNQSYEAMLYIRKYCTCKSLLGPIRTNARNEDRQNFVRTVAHSVRKRCLHYNSFFNTNLLLIKNYKKLGKITFFIVANFAWLEMVKNLVK